jgi:hypothetical protein
VDTNGTQICRPWGIAIDRKSKDLFVADMCAHHIRRLVRNVDAGTETWTITSIRVQMGDTFPRDLMFHLCQVDELGYLYAASDNLLIRCKLDGTGTKVISNYNPLSLPPPTTRNFGFRVSSGVIFLIHGARIRKLHPFQHWNQEDHRHFSVTTRLAIKTVMVAAHRSDQNLFAKVPRELLLAILSFIPFSK